jgi:diguanylate cyclase
VTCTTREAVTAVAPRWSVFALRRPAFLLLGATELSAIAVVAVAHRFDPVDRPVAWLQLAVLAIVGLLYAQVTSQAQVVRRYLAADRAPISNVTAVWALPAALALPMTCAIALNLVLGGYALAWSVRRRVSKPHRVLFNAAVGMLASAVASRVSYLSGARAGFGGGPWNLRAMAGVLGAVASYAVLDAVLVVMVVALATHPVRPRMVLPSRDNTCFEFVTLVLGVIGAAVLGHSLWIVPLLGVVLLFAQRSVAVGQLRSEADIDAKTGLLTYAAWHRQAEYELQRATRTERSAAVLVVDLDHFKAVNDDNGHLVGDEVLGAVGRYLRSALRGYDAVGRFGGEEFTAVLPDTEAQAADQIAARVCAGIAGLDLGRLSITASIGVARFPHDGPDLRAVLSAADDALLLAKQSGRNRVQTFAASRVC